MSALLREVRILRTRLLAPQVGDGEGVAAVGVGELGELGRGLDGLAEPSGVSVVGDDGLDKGGHRQRVGEQEGVQLAWGVLVRLDDEEACLLTCVPRALLLLRTLQLLRIDHAVWCHNEHRIPRDWHWLVFARVLVVEHAPLAALAQPPLEDPAHRVAVRAVVGCHEGIPGDLRRPRSDVALERALVSVAPLGVRAAVERVSGALICRAVSARVSGIDELQLFALRAVGYKLSQLQTGHVGAAGASCHKAQEGNFSLHISLLHRRACLVRIRRCLMRR
eukprot:scaffold534_cov63-Phaeocystis_antarctica.AAC.3